MSYPDAASAHLAPKKPVYLSGTGTAEDSNITPLTGGCYATLKAGAASLRVRFLGEASVAGAVATTDLLIAANERYDWVVEPKKTDFVYVEAGDGAAAYEAWVWTSSPPV